jgi:glucose/arabinose dehydrogenase
MRKLNGLLITLGVLAISSLSVAGTYQSLTADCDGFPQLPVVSISGTCLGLVAQRDQQPLLKMPRSLLQTTDNKLLIVDMGGWSPGRGQLLMLDYSAPTKTARVLLSQLNLPHKILMGPNDKIYISEANRIRRFEWKDGSLTNIQTVIDGLPYHAEYLHPLKSFIFDLQGNLLVNIGSSSDRCEKKVPLADCKSGVEAAIRRYAYNRETDSFSQNYEVIARGLRNSMALVVHSSGTVMQAENSMDFPDANEPYEELNVIEDNGFYGWPVCYNKDVALDGKPCREANYRAPWTLLPPHVAPLDMLYYQHNKLPQLTNKLLMSWHGYRVVGNRLVAYDIDGAGRPKLQDRAYFWRAPEQSGGEYTKHPMMPKTGLVNENNMRTLVAQHEEIISQWHAVPGVRSEGAPVGLTQAADGSVFIVDDRNAAILRLSVGKSYTSQQLSHLPARDVSAKSLLPPSEVTALLKKRCAHCHNELHKQPAQLLNLERWLQKNAEANTLMEQRIFKDKVRPMPADGQLTPAEKSTLQNWFNTI